MRPFHLAFPVTDLEATRRFYGEIMGCGIGREDPGRWIDFDLFGHQMSAHLRPASAEPEACGGVDGDAVPIPHFGVVLKMDDWKALAARLEAEPSIVWRLKPKIRFEGQPGEQATMFVMDPSGNALEFKGFSDDAQIFAA